MKTRKAFIIKKNGEKFWFDIPKDTAQKVLRLQKMFKDENQKKKITPILKSSKTERLGKVVFRLQSSEQKATPSCQAFVFDLLPSKA
jgi:hypothetical protein